MLPGLRLQTTCGPCYMTHKLRAVCSSRSRLRPPPLCRSLCGMPGSQLAKSVRWLDLIPQALGSRRSSSDKPRPEGIRYSMNGNSEGNLYRLLPPLHELLQTTDFAALLEIYSRDSVVDGARAVLERLKTEIGDGRHTQMSLESEVAQMHVTVANEVAESARFRLRRVINATGVVLHTNLGRAPLSASALAHICDTASGYSNLELDLESGERSRRDVHVEELLLRVAANQSDAATMSALVVNNCAAATFLALNTLAEGGEVIVSRGELVEIGGGFRIPEILVKSGAILREVGTTNRTRLADYEDAISAATRLILRVHQSNFSMKGFVERPSLPDLVSLAKHRKL